MKHAGKMVKHDEKSVKNDDKNGETCWGNREKLGTRDRKYPLVN